MINYNKKKLAVIFLLLGQFFNPLGTDIIQLLLIHLTGSLSNAYKVLYLLAIICFAIYFILTKTNPFIELINIVKNIYYDTIKHYYKRKNSKKVI